MQGFFLPDMKIEEEGNCCRSPGTDCKGQGMSEESRKNWTMPKQLWYLFDDFRSGKIGRITLEWPAAENEEK